MEQNTLQNTVNWLEQALPINPKNACVQLGCLIEEMDELFDAMGYLAQHPLRVALVHEANELKQAQDGDENTEWSSKLQQNKLGAHDEQLKALADALTDIIVTATSSGRQLGVDMVMALGEVNRANYSKFEKGRPVFDENGKVKKGQFYIPPDLRVSISQHSHNSLSEYLANICSQASASLSGKEQEVIEEFIKKFQKQYPDYEDYPLSSRMVDLTKGNVQRSLLLVQMQGAHEDGQDFLAILGVMRQVKIEGSELKSELLYQSYGKEDWQDVETDDMYSTLIDAFKNIP